MLLRASKVPSIDFEKFQEEFDLDLLNHTRGMNNFKSVADLIHVRYSHVNLNQKVFQKDEGKLKLRFIEEFVFSGKPILVSINIQIFSGVHGWHIMLVVDATENKLLLLKSVLVDGTMELFPILKTELVRIHKEYQGGDDIAYLQI